MGRAITTTMTTEAQLLRLMTWLSPAFPVGAFGYSHGLETAIREGLVRDADTLAAWVGGLVELGGGWTDAVLFTAAWEASAARDALALAELVELAEALAPTLERRRETLAQGEAFLVAARAWGPPELNGPVAYPVAVGSAAARAGIPAGAALTAWLHAFCANLVSVAVRAIPIGQTDGVAVIAALEPTILATAGRAAASTLDDLGACALNSDIAAMRHETLDGRLFAS
ncbi:urease accessory protein UreF [Phenylobacterium sp.]|uniref:urease accessory protein UreF n=1 Tax=Phenylobacterium sp. TaxID=1871053 RepID=UPI002CE2C060|nr:urease accessory protein UreF [Phenylobacterium sp.]HLZ76503.1 urease accessory protein UreF [Phenylobacterium sp.]